MAEYGWALSKEMEDKAKQELNEVPEEKHAAISAVREQIETRPDISNYAHDNNVAFSQCRTALIS